MAQGRAVSAAVGLGIDIPSLAHSGGTRNVVAQVKTVVRRWQIGADTGVHFMVTIGLLVPVHEILGHVSCLALCSTEKAPTPQGLWWWRCTCRFPEPDWLWSPFRHWFAYQWMLAT